MGRTLNDQVAYTGGEVSPLLDARVDLPIYQTACRKLQNMIVLKQGGATRRPGTVFCQRTKFYNNPALTERLMKFQFSPSTRFTLEFGQNYIRFFSNGRPVEVSPGVPVEVASPYTATEGPDSQVFEVIPCQVYDVIYLTHPEHVPYKLTRIADDIWTLAPVSFFIPAMLDQNGTGMYIGVIAGGTTGPVTLSANAETWVTGTFYQVGDSVNPGGAVYTCLFSHVAGAVFAADDVLGYWKEEIPFQAGHVGSVWQLAHARQAEYIEIEISGDGDSAEIQAVEATTFETFGEWTADVVLQRLSGDGLSWENVRVITSRADNNESIPLVIAESGTYRIHVQNWVSVGGTTTPRAVFTVEPSIVRGLVLITQVNNPFNADGTVIKELYTTNSTRAWCEGAWSELRGYPRCCTLFQQRMVYGSTSYEPQRIWGTVTNDLENLDLGTQAKATDSFKFDLAAIGRGPILWLIGQVDLFAGFMGAEWIINAGSGAFGGSTEPITPTQINAGEHSAWGSAEGVPPAVVGNAVLYTQRAATTIQQMEFSVYTNKYQSNDLTSVAEHLFGSGIVQIDQQQQFRTQQIVWVVTRSGSLCGMTYDQQLGVFGWHRHLTGLVPGGANDAGFQSLAVIYGEGQDDDEVWVVANRSNGRFVEFLNPANWELAGPDVDGIAQPDLAQAIYVDAAVTVVSPVSNVISGLTHLAGRSVIGMINGVTTSVFGPVVVDGAGQVTIEGYEPASGDVVQVGLPVYYKMQPMRLDADARSGVTVGVKKGLSKVFIRLFNSLTGALGSGDPNIAGGPIPIEYRTRATPLGVYPTLYTGQKEVLPRSTVSYDATYVVEGSDALPLTLLATTVREGITGSA